jgi:RimJ/RimL family protein N-acetyltransferase
MVTWKYVDWMNDPEVTRYTESQFCKHTFDSIVDYVKEISASSNDYFYGVYLDNEHIGNIKLTIDMHHNSGSIGIIIGDKQQWGKGYATEAIRVLTKYGFETLELHKISAGIYYNNKGSIRAFEKAGYFQEATLKNNRLVEGKYVDEVIMSKFKGGDSMKAVVINNKYNPLDMKILRSKESTTISSEEALKDIEPIDWSDEVLSGKKKVTL